MSRKASGKRMAINDPGSPYWEVRVTAPELDKPSVRTA